VIAPQNSNGKVEIHQKAPALWMPPTKRIENLSDPSDPDRFLIVNPEDIGAIYFCLNKSERFLLLFIRRSFYGELRREKLEIAL
jgi:hypothetical protein